MATRSSVLAWRIPWMGSLVGCHLWGRTESDMTEATQQQQQQQQGFPDSSVGIESAFNAGDPGLIPGLGRSVGKGIGYPLQYSWVSLVDQLVKNSLQCRKPGFSPLAVMIHWRRECQSIPVFLPGEFHGQRSHGSLQSMASHRVGHD